MLNRLKLTTLASIGVLILGSCGEDANKATTMDAEEQVMPEEVTISTSDKIQFQRAKIVLFSLPSPMETARILKKSGAIYDSKYLNKVANLEKYETSKRKAVAMGIYIADLSYSNVFNQQQACMDYFAAINEIANDISLSDVFTKDLVERVDKHIAHEDSVLKYLTEAYWKANMELKEDDRESMAGLIAAGGWIEGLYIATHLMNPDSKNDAVMDRIAEQEATLKQLIKFLSSYRDDKNLLEIISDLERMQKLFRKIEIETVRVDQTSDDGVAVVGKRKVYIFPEGVLEDIIKTANEIRNKYA